MKPADNIKNLIKNTKIQSNPATSQAVLTDLLARMDKAAGANPTAVQQNTWRRIMKSKITKLTVAALFIVAVTITITFLDTTTPAYGISSALNSYKNADTIHIHGWAYMPSVNNSGKEFTKVPLEMWFDLERGYYKLIKPGGIDRATGEPKYFTIISDGQYVMKDSYMYPLDGEAYKVVRFERLSEFQSRLQSYNSAYSFLMQTFGSVDLVNGFVRLSDEVVNGIRCGIWEGVIATPGPTGQMQVKIKSWISLETGELKMVQMWQQLSEAEEWKPIMEIDQIELDIKLPEGIFTTEPPADSKLDNTKDTAPWAQLGSTGVGVGDLMLDVNMSFTLADGSVIICWQSTDQGQASQGALFSGLEFGGDLPKLPIEIYALKAIGKPVAEYLGYHLAYSKKDEKYFEWSIYIPQGEIPSRESILGYEVVHKFNVDNEEKIVGSMTLTVSDDIPINTRQEFSTWVLGAFKELSNNEQIPSNINYNSIKDLTEKLRDTSYQQ